MTRLSNVLIANRGEIAIRIARSARALGYGVCGVYSEADRHAPHVRAMDQAALLGPAPPRESYLHIDRILAAVRTLRADAIHPGYGFLSENADLAEQCEREHLVWIGPPSRAIRFMGDKVRAKEAMERAGVPIVPGYHGADQSPGHLAEQAETLGYPLMIKAAAGGGGRGMRIVRTPAEIAQAIESAAAEALSAFGDGRLLLEKLVEQGRHIEVQLVADTHGNAAVLGERDCSAQRRHQKVLEESPAPGVDDTLRRQLGDAALAAARAAGYVNAGTVEFILSPTGEYFFLEMNTRLQVEHPVTELVTGLDLVDLQFRIAAGEKLPFHQDEIRMSGHAIEARLYAEDPQSGFLPQSGRVSLWVAPGEGVRVDAGIESGTVVPPDYDAMLAKLVVHGPTREVAVRRLERALLDTVLLGLTTNREFLMDIAKSEAFREARITTRLLDEWGRRQSDEGELTALAALLVALRDRQGNRPWSNSGEAVWPIALSGRGQSWTARVRHLSGERYEVEAGGRATAIELIELGATSVRFEEGGVQKSARFVWVLDVLHIACGLSTEWFEPVRMKEAARSASGDGAVRAPIPGRLVSVLVGPGERVRADQCVAVLETMKMEHRVLASVTGVVESVAASRGAQVAARQVLLTISPSATDGGS